MSGDKEYALTGAVLTAIQNFDRRFPHLRILSPERKTDPAITFGLNRGEGAIEIIEGVLADNVREGIQPNDIVKILILSGYFLSALIIEGVLTIEQLAQIKDKEDELFIGEAKFNFPDGSRRKLRLTVGEPEGEFYFKTYRSNGESIQ